MGKHTYRIAMDAIATLVLAGAFLVAGASQWRALGAALLCVWGIGVIVAARTEAL